MITQDYLKSILYYDEETGDFVWKIDKGKCKINEIAGCLRSDGYVIISIDDKDYLAHRLAWFYMTGVWPERIDHENVIPSDNRWKNLREATVSQNGFNCHTYINNRLGIKGVKAVHNRFMARIVINGKRIYLGLFNTAEEAKAAYDLAANQTRGKFARLE